MKLSQYLHNFDYEGPRVCGDNNPSEDVHVPHMSIYNPVFRKCSVVKLILTISVTLLSI